MTSKLFSLRRLCEKEIHKCLALALSLLLLVQPLIVNVSAQQPIRKQRNASGKTKRLSNAQRIAHVLKRLSFGARPGDFERVQAMGLDAYIKQQLEPEAIDDSLIEKKLASMPTLALATPTLIEQYNPPKPPPTPTPMPSPSPSASPMMTNQNTSSQMTMTPDANKNVSPQPSTTEMKKADAKDAGPVKQNAPKPPARNPQQGIIDLQRATILRAVYSERQLYEMVVAFWDNHFSVFSQKDADRFLLPSFDRDAIRPFALGRFRDLLGATAHSPAMLFYLDNWVSSVAREYPAKDGKPARKVGGVNENYARELMELHTLGVDGGYTQKDVQEVARCFTGWTIRKPNEEGLFFFNPAAHDNGEKIVLGHKIPTGGGIRDGEMVLDILARHPSTAKFIATKLARRFISDDPPASVVNRAAQVFLKTDGDIRETLRAIIKSPEFFSSASYRTKVKSPFEYAASTVRILGVDTDAGPQIIDWIAKMGQPMFGKITPDGYADRTDQWLSTGQMLARLNFASAVALKISGAKFNGAKLLEKIDLNDLSAVSEKLKEAVLSGDLSSQTRTALEKLVNGPAEQNADVTQPKQSQTEKQMQVNAAFQGSDIPKEHADKLIQLITLIVGSPEFQRR